MASLLLVGILVVLISLVSIGFSRLVNRDVSVAVEDQKAKIASYAAESGINQVVGDLSNGSPLTAKTQSSCQNDLLASLNSNGGLSGDKNTEYTCVLLNLAPSTLTYQRQQPFTSRVVKLQTPQPLTSLFVTWKSNIDNNKFASGGQLLSETSWNGSKFLPLLRVTLYSIPHTSSLNLTAGYSAHTYFLYPGKSGKSVINLSGSQATADGSLVNVNCTTRSFSGFPYQSPGSQYCSAVFSGLPNTSDSGSYFYVRLTPIYGVADINLQGQTANPVSTVAPMGNTVAATSAIINQAASSALSVAPQINPNSGGSAGNAILIASAYPNGCPSKLPYLVNCKYIGNGQCAFSYNDKNGLADVIKPCTYYGSGSSSGSSGGSSGGGNGSSGGGNSSSGSGGGGGGGGGGGTVQFGGVQAVIDVTAKSNDVVKRLQARVELSGDNLTTDNIPEFALESASTICKRYVVAAGSVTIDPGSLNDCGGTSGGTPPPPSQPPSPPPSQSKTKIVNVRVTAIEDENATVQAVVLGVKNGSSYICARSPTRSLEGSPTVTLTAIATTCPDNEINNVGSVLITYNNGNCDVKINPYDCVYHHSVVSSVTYTFNGQPAKAVKYSSNGGACVPKKGNGPAGPYNITCGTSPYVMNASGNLTFKTTNP